MRMGSVMFALLKLRIYPSTSNSYSTNPTSSSPEKGTKKRHLLMEGDA